MRLAYVLLGIVIGVPAGLVAYTWLLVQTNKQVGVNTEKRR